MQRRLKALGYPNAVNFNPGDNQEFRQVVLWLENNKIRHFGVRDREGLMTVTDDAKWKAAFDKYLKDLDCPIEMYRDELSESATSVNLLTWLLGHAIKVDYFSKGVEYNLQSKAFLASHEVNSEDEKRKKFSANPLENMDYQSQEFKEGVAKLSQLLKVPPHLDHLITLEACCKLIQKRLNPKATKDPSKVVGAGEPFSLSDHDMGFGNSVHGQNDPVLKEAAKILRLIHLTNLRELQSNINNTIELVQRVTANPKTDTKLGKVGS